MTHPNHPTMNFIKCSLCFTDAKLMVLAAKQKLVVQKLLAIELEPKEDEPDLICNSCFSILSEFNQFRKRIRRLRNVQESEVDSSTVEDSDNVTTTFSSSVIKVADDQSSKKKRNSTTGNDSINGTVSVVHSVPINITNKEIPERENRVNLQGQREDSDVPNIIQEGEETNVDLQERRKRNLPNDTREVARTIRSLQNVSKEQRICSVCFTICDSMKHLIQHRRTEHPEMVQYECTDPNCSEVFADPAERSLHKAQKHPKCKTCHAKFDNPSALKRHRCRLKKFKCPKECGERFETEEQLRKHFKRCRPGTTMHHCPFCKKVFSCTKSLKEHVKICNVRTRSPTTKSPADGIQNTAVNESLERLAPSTDKTNFAVTCAKCSQEFSSISTLKIHYLSCNIENLRVEHSVSREKEVHRKHNAKTSLSSKKDNFEIQEEITDDNFEIEIKEEKTDNDFELEIKEEKTDVIDLNDGDADFATPLELNNQTTDTTAVSTTLGNESGVFHRSSKNEVLAKQPFRGFTRDSKIRPKNVMENKRPWRMERGYNERRRDPPWNGRVYRDDRKHKYDKRGDFWKPFRSRFHTSG